MTSAPPPAPRHRWYAAVYDAVISKGGEKKLAPIRAQVAGGASGQVLEVGCGTGANFAFYDWPKVDALVATEPDPFMLARAEAKLRALEPAVRSKVRLLEAPAEALPFEDASFDCLVATLVYCTVSDLNRSLAEAHRVLKPGGTLRLAEHVASTGFEASVQRVIQPVYGWFAAGCSLNRHTEDALRSAGFKLDVTQRTSLGPLYPAFVGVATKS
ncbi:MAG TPA: class I SAM-dependent methyltransferase [Dehalococcoidia bacterium]|nr:class I SAM-dependent methyltransferase [Dehalococcoidia bacterium]